MVHSLVRAPNIPRRAAWCPEDWKRSEGMEEPWGGTEGEAVGEGAGVEPATVKLDIMASAAAVDAAEEDATMPEAAAIADVESEEVD